MRTGYATHNVYSCKFRENHSGHSRWKRMKQGGSFCNGYNVTGITCSWGSRHVGTGVCIVADTNEDRLRVICDSECGQFQAPTRITYIGETLALMLE